MHSSRKPVKTPVLYQSQILQSGIQIFHFSIRLCEGVVPAMRPSQHLYI
jgi:hypothetical protein